MEKVDFKMLEIDEMFDYLVDEVGVNDLWRADDLKEYAIAQVRNDNLNVAIHILNYMYYNESYYYHWDCTMGTMEELQAISCEEDIIDLVENVYCIEFEPVFDDEYNIFCYSDENGDNLVCCEHTSEYENAVAIADDLYEKFERVEILDKYGEKVY